MYRLGRTLLKLPRLRVTKSLAIHKQKSSHAGSHNPVRRDGKMRTFATQAAAEPFLNGSSSVYVEEMYLAWQRNPSSVHKSWDTFFRQATAGVPPGLAYTPPPGLRSGTSALAVPLPSDLVETGTVSNKVIEDHLAVQSIIRSYQVIGHRFADLDPLGMDKSAMDKYETPKNLMLHFAQDRLYTVARLTGGGKTQGRTTNPLEAAGKLLHVLVLAKPEN